MIRIGIELDIQASFRACELIFTESNLSKVSFLPPKDESINTEMKLLSITSRPNATPVR